MKLDLTLALVLAATATALPLIDWYPQTDGKAAHADITINTKRDMQARAIDASRSAIIHKEGGAVDASSVESRCSLWTRVLEVKTRIVNSKIHQNMQLQPLQTLQAQPLIQFSGEHLNSFLEVCETHFGNVGFSEDAKRIDFITSKFSTGVKEKYQLWTNERIAEQRKEFNKKKGLAASDSGSTSTIARDELLHDFLGDGFVYYQHSYKTLILWLHRNYDAFDTVITSSHLRKLAEKYQKSGYTQISDYMAQFEALVGRMTAVNKPEANNLISIFLSGCKPIHARELIKNSMNNGVREYDWIKFRALIHVENEVDRELISIDNGNEQLEYVNPFLNAQPKPVVPVVAPNPQTLDPMAELTRQFEAMRLVVLAGGSLDSCTTVPQQVRDLYRSLLFSSQQTTPVQPVVNSSVPFAPLAPPAASIHVQTPAPAPTPGVIPVRRPQICLVCDLTKAKQRESGIVEHDNYNECPFLKEFVDKGYPIKKAPVQTPQGERIHLVQSNGERFPFMIGKGGIRKFLMDKNAEAMKKGQDGTKLMMINNNASDIEEIQQYPEDLHFEPVQYDGKPELYLDVGVGKSNFKQCAEVLKNISGLEITDEEADRAWTSLISITGSDEGVVFTCAQVIQEVTYARDSAADVFAKRGREDTEKVPDSPIEKARRVQPLRQRPLANTPFEMVNVSPIPSARSHPPPPSLPPSVQPPSMSKPVSSTVAKAPPGSTHPESTLKQSPVPLESLLPKKVQKYRYGKKGPLMEIVVEDVVKRTLNKPYMGYDSFYEFLAVTPEAVNHILECIKTHRIYPKEEASVPEPLPMVVDNIQADASLIQRKVLESSPTEPVPEAICSIFRSNAVELAKWEGGMQNLERISACLHKFTSIPHFGTELGYEPVSNIQNNFKAKMFSMGVGASPAPTFSPQTQYSTYGSPYFGNVLFQKTFNVHKVLMDKGSEINACSFDIARDVAAAGKGAYDLSVLLFMTHAGGGRNEMYGLFRDCEFLLEGKMESRQKCWICPRGEPTPFAVLFGMPFIASMRATSSWDSRGNMWTKLTAQDGSFSAQYQTVNYNNARNVVEPQKRQVEDVADLNVLPWVG
ncbi:hypothetical protein BDR26DRAFT_931196 [Obelidium mucronatum]|nr:hypothetical protein BDR26DRAFT_931196 [Obelidium mucronatum]